MTSTIAITGISHRRVMSTPVKIKHSRQNIPDNVIVTVVANGRSATKKPREQRGLLQA